MQASHVFRARPIFHCVLHDIAQASTKPSKRFVSSKHLQPARRHQLRPATFTFQLLHDFHISCRSSLLRRFRQTRPYASAPPPRPNITPALGSPEPSLSLSQRMRKLSREYGWSAVGVYFALSALDFPFCFIAVRMLGTERIARWEHAVIEAVKTVLQYPMEKMGWSTEDLKAVKEQVVSVVRHGEESSGGSVGTGGVDQALGKEADWRWGVEEAQAAAKKQDATIWTQLALAYAIHKSFIFMRVPLTAAVTPKVVKVLRGWGWDIGKRRPKTINQ